MNIKHDAISPLIFQRLKQEVFGSIPWFFTPNTAYPSSADNAHLNFSYVHHIYGDGRPSSELYDLVDLAVRSALDNTGQTLSLIYRIRLGMITALDVPFVHGAHIDMDVPHMTGLIYLNDSDGDTIFYKERFRHGIDFLPTNWYESESDRVYNVEETVTPKENTFVWFDGLQYHSSSTPKTTSRRIVININYQN
jgi:hypothetical protein